jgi:hypothetical protein
MIKKRKNKEVASQTKSKTFLDMDLEKCHGIE